MCRRTGGARHQIASVRKIPKSEILQNVWQTIISVADIHRPFPCFHHLHYISLLSILLFGKRDYRWSAWSVVSADHVGGVRLPNGLCMKNKSAKLHTSLFYYRSQLLQTNPRDAPRHADCVVKRWRWTLSVINFDDRRAVAKQTQRNRLSSEYEKSSRAELPLFLFQHNN